MFALHNIGRTNNESGTAPDNRDSIPGSAKFDLDITALESGNKILFEIQYCSRLFKAETIRRFSQYFKNIVAAVIQNSSVRLGDIDILPEDERRYLLQTLNDSAADYPAGKAVHRLFEEQAARCPDKVALIGPARETVTYAQMNAAANRLARTLRHRGFNTGDIAAVTAAPSAQRIIALMAILKAGGAYLPNESGAPAERVRFILEDSAAAFVVTEEQLPETLVNNRAIFPLTRGGTNAPEEPDQSNLDIDPGAQSPAYVIYTSGSTGKPKGVLVRRSNLRSYIFAFYREFDINAGDTVIQQASFSFDAFVEEMYPVLLRGGKIAVPTKQEVLDIQLLVDFIVQNNVTMISASPLLLNELNQYPGSEALPVRIYISGGDVLNPGHIDKLVKTARVYNTYGPTESTVCVTYYNCTHLPENAVSVPIGKPIANASVYVLDKRMNLTPIGVPGELCVAGPGVTAGYINRPELTAEKFNQYFQDYHDDQDKKIEADNRLYRTGDLVRWDSDGNLEFLGRIDNQVQIRGFRIELGEIEQALLRHEAVKEAVVFARTDNQNHRYLCAYIVGNTLTTADNETSSAPALKQYLSAALPEYMIPAYIMKLETLPLTPTGKVDRKALPAPELKAGKNYIAPCGAVEKKLTQLWAQVLNTSDAVIGIRDNFFELGGHSLKATVLISRIRKEMGVNLPLVTLFKSPTIEQMARSIEACTPDVDDTPAQNRQDVVLLKKASGSDFVNAPNLFFIHEGYGEVAGYTEFCAALSDHYNCWGIRSGSFEGIAPVYLSIRETARNYAEKIKALQEQGPYHMFGWCIGGTLAFEIVSILEQEGEEVGFFAMADTPPPRPSRAAQAEDFSLRGELKAVNRAVKGIDESLYNDLKQSRDVAGLWNRIVDFLNSSPSEDPELTVHIRRMLGEEKSSAIPNFYNMSAFELLKTINTGRGLGAARDRYVPQRKIKTLVHFFSAEKGGVKNQHQWNRYTFTPVKSHVARGGHYSMFRGANAAALARQTMQILESLKAGSRDVQTIAEQLPRKMKSHK